MDIEIKKESADSICSFKLPKYDELPDIGLYLEQTTQYINSCLAPLGCIEITSSMIRNYVKKDLVKNPIQKQYFANQIAHLIAVTVLKNVISLENISQLLSMQKQIYTDEVAYNYFCMELENVLSFRFGFKDSIDNIGTTSTIAKEMLRSAVTAVSHTIYINACFKHLEKESENQSVR